MSAIVTSSPFSGLDCAGFDFTFYAGGRLDLCPAQFVFRVQVKPVALAGTKIAGQSQGGVGRDAASLANDVIHGARAALRWARGKEAPLGAWISPVVTRRGMNKAVLALANKIARISWNVMAKGCTYEPHKAFKGA